MQAASPESEKTAGCRTMTSSFGVGDGTARCGIPHRRSNFCADSPFPVGAPCVVGGATMASARGQPSGPEFESQIHNRFRESVYREQGRRGLGPYSVNQTPFGRSAHGGGFHGGDVGHATTSGAELKRTRNLFEERVRFYLGRGTSGKGHLGGLSQAGLANVRRRTTSGVTSRACADCKKITLSLTGE